jgi:hypothetical protein
MFEPTPAISVPPHFARNYSVFAKRTAALEDLRSQIGQIDDAESEGEYGKPLCS